MKQDSFPAFLLKLAALSALLYGLLFLAETKVSAMQGIPKELMIAVLFVITGISHFIITKTKEKSPQIFTRAYMGTSTARLILYSVFILVYCFGHRDVAKVFVLVFFVLYIVYTIFEVRSVQSHLKKK